MQAAASTDFNGEFSIGRHGLTLLPLLVHFWPLLVSDCDTTISVCTDIVLPQFVLVIQLAKIRFLF